MFDIKSDNNIFFNDNKNYNKGYLEVTVSNAALDRDPYWLPVLVYLELKRI